MIWRYSKSEGKFQTYKKTEFLDNLFNKNSVIHLDRFGYGDNEIWPMRKF